MKSRVLLAHNFYDSSLPSGEARVLEAERTLLKQHGHEISEFFRYSDEILGKGAWGTLKGALSTPWNPFSAREVSRAVDRFSPDVVHVHNTFPLLSPAIFHSIGNRATRVLTLHNYRIFCSAAIPMRAGSVCTECIDRQSIWPALRYGCYRNSRFATLPIALNVALHRKMHTWVDQVDAFIVFTEFQRALMVKAGLPAELVHVKPNFYPGDPPVLPWEDRKQSVVFAGRLTAEKGVESLIHAWVEWGSAAPELRIVGDGDSRKELERLAALAPQVPIRFLGQLTGDATQKEIAHSRLLMLPSQCIEGFPMVLREAFAFGTPAAVSDIGPLPSIVRHGENGVVFSPDNARSLLEVVQAAWNGEGELERLGAGARRTFDEFYTDEANYRLLMDIYQQAMEVNQNRKT